MPIDPSIPLQVQRPRFVGPADLISLRNLRTQAETGELALAEARRKREQEVALRDLLRRPGAVDEATGEVSAEGLAGISRLDPVLGLQLRREQRVALSELNKHVREQAAFQTEQSKRQTELTKSVLQKAVAAHDLAVGAGAAPKGEAAVNAFRNAYATALAELKKSGALAAAGVSEEEIAQAEAIPWDVDRARAWVATPEQALEAAQYAPEGGSPPANVPLSQVGQPQPPQGIVQPEGATTFPADTAVPEAHEIPDNEAEPRVVTEDRPIETPDDLRRRARALEAKGGKVNFERAKDLRARATAEEGRILEEARLEESRKTREEAAEARKQTAATKEKEFVAKIADDYRAEQNVKQYRIVKPLFEVLQQAAKSNTRAANVNMIYAIANMFDPGSVVKEGEYLTVKRAGGLPSEIKDLISWLNGGSSGLTDQVRSDFVEQGRIRLNEYTRAYETTAEGYKDFAKRHNIDFRDIERESQVTPRKAKSDTKPPPPGTGTRQPKPLTEEEKKELERLRQWERDRPKP